MSRPRRLEFAPDGKPIYVLHGENIRTLEDFYREIGEAIDGPGDQVQNLL